MTLGPEVGEGLRNLEQIIVDRAKSLQRQRDFIEQVRKAASMDPPNYSVLRRLLALSAKEEVARECGADAAFLGPLQEATDRAWAQMPVRAVNEFYELARDSGLPIGGQAPRFTVGRGLEVTFDVDHNRTTVNGTVIQTVDPREVLDRLRAEHERLWGGRFNASREMARIYSAYTAVASRTEGAADGVSLLDVYAQAVNSLPRSERKGYTKDSFTAAISRLLEAGARSADGKFLLLKPTATRTDALRIFLPDENDWAYRGRIMFKDAG